MNRKRLQKLQDHMEEYRKDVNKQWDFFEDGDETLLINLIQYYFENEPEQNIFTNVNIGVKRKDENTINKIEAELDALEIFYDNEGGNEKIYNINAGFKNREQAEYFISRWEDKVYVETETFEQDR